MTRSFTIKDPDKGNRREKPFILIVAEGKNNKTETNYFNSFIKPNSKYVLYVHGTGGPTDPGHMKKTLEALWSHYDMSADNGDFGYIVLDLDCEDEKASKIKLLKKDLERNVSFIVSNPCFEVWFLLHYQNSAGSFMSSDKVIDELKKHIPGYDKALDVSKSIDDSRDEALCNADRIINECKSQNLDWPSNACNPRTDVPVIFHVLQKIERG